MSPVNDREERGRLSLGFVTRRARVERLEAELRSERSENATLKERLIAVEEALAGTGEVREQLRAAEEALASAREARQQLQYHKDTLRRTRQRMVGPSFHRELQANINYADALRDLGITHPLRNLVDKLRNYDFAASHGVPTPLIYQTWEGLEDLKLDGLPDEFVVKFDGGASSKGVLPLRRTGRDRYASVDGHHEYAENDVRAILAEASARGQAYGTLFAEELLKQTGRAGVPDDIKIYIAYGHVLQVLLRRVDKHGAQDTVANKYVDESGSDLGEVTTTRRFDSSIPVPDRLPEMVKIAKHLSRAIGVPFCRVDLYETTRGIVLGEITRSPGGAQTYRMEHDRWMGTQWLRGRAGLDHDLMAGRPFGTIHGHRRADGVHPEGVPVDAEWRRTVLPCDAWCETPAPRS